MFNFLVAKEERTVKMVEGSTCEVFGTGTIIVTCRDGTVHVLELVRYVSKARYNLISIGGLDEEGCRIQVQQGIVTVSQGDRIVLKDTERTEAWRNIQAERRKLSSTWSFRDKLGRELIASGASKKTATRRESSQSVTGRRNGTFGQDLRWPRLGWIV